MHTNSHLWYLQHVDLFGDLSLEQVAQVTQCFVDRVHPPGAVIDLTAGDKQLWMVKQGLVELAGVTSSGKRVILSWLGPGSMVSSPRQDNLFFELKVKKRTVLCSSTEDDFFTAIAQYPQVSTRLLRALFTQVKDQQRWISSLATESVPDRLLRMIKELAPRWQRHDIPAFTHEEFAQLLGTSRQTVTTLLNQLEKGGRIERVGKYYQALQV